MGETSVSQWHAEISAWEKTKTTRTQRVSMPSGSSEQGAAFELRMNGPAAALEVWVGALRQMKRQLRQRPKYRTDCRVPWVNSNLPYSGM